MKNFYNIYPEGGFKKGELVIFKGCIRFAGPAAYELLSTVDISGVTWYTVKITTDQLHQWVVDQNCVFWKVVQSSDEYFVHSTKVIMHEQLYNMFLLRWS